MRHPVALPPKANKYVGQALGETTPYGTALNLQWVQLFEQLMLIPADVALAVSSRDLDMRQGSHCLLGWTVREHFYKVAGIDPSEINILILDGSFPSDTKVDLSIPSRRSSKDRGVLGQILDGFNEADEICENLYGGDPDLWTAIFQGVTGDVGCNPNGYRWVTLQAVEYCWVVRIEVAATYGI